MLSEESIAFARALPTPYTAVSAISRRFLSGIVTPEILIHSKYPKHRNQNTNKAQKHKLPKTQTFQPLCFLIVCVLFVFCAYLCFVFLRPTPAFSYAADSCTRPKSALGVGRCGSEHRFF